MDIDLPSLAVHAAKPAGAETGWDCEASSRACRFLRGVSRSGIPKPASGMCCGLAGGCVRIPECRPAMIRSRTAGTRMQARIGAYPLQSPKLPATKEIRKIRGQQMPSFPFPDAQAAPAHAWIPRGRDRPATRAPPAFPSQEVSKVSCASESAASPQQKPGPPRFCYWSGKSSVLPTGTATLYPL